MTRWWSGAELAREAERLAPGCVARADAAACLLRADRALEAFRALRDDAETDFVHLTNLCAVDLWDRFEVVYHLQSLTRNHIACVKVETADRESPAVSSVTGVWQGAWIQESEAYDLFGIRFEGHPNPQRILLWDGYPGHPLRKDFLAMPGGLQPGLNEFAGAAARPEPPVRPVP